MGGGEMMVSDDEIVMRIMGVVQNADLTTTSTAAIRRQLEEDLGTDLTEKKAFIREQVDLYLQAQQQQQQQQHQQHQHHLYHYLHSLQQQQQQQPFLQPHYYAANYAPPQVVEDDADVDEDNVVQRDPEPDPRHLSHAKTKRAKKDGLPTCLQKRSTMTVKAVAVLSGSEGVSGTVFFTQNAEGSTCVSGKLSGLKPGLHGFHVHALGDTTNGCMSTGGHFNPKSHEHGGPDDVVRHAGDLGNVIVGEDGCVDISITDSQIPLAGENSIVGRAIVVHADEDDLGKGGHELSKTTGNAGGRLACGVIGLQAAA